ncbi:pyridoxamine 5'-phosphate oxidase family protein [Thalassobacillus hwangdonensis]|uniref:Pyridoxamine 5'-phosphate oxidase family protein n=1 Tax=Thalassobacillus hwangdonensis TaxID=546108 RepID=A0ABW3L1B2_9BACI
MSDTYQITSHEALTALQGEPGKLAANKVIKGLDPLCEAYLAATPFVVLSTSNSNGDCDSSPRGDAPGFIYVQDENTLYIPERPGNKRMDSLHNILDNPHIGMLCMIPGLNETLRINGSAALTTDPSILEKMEANGKLPKLAIKITVKECYIHCAKAFIRSHLWKPESWQEKSELPVPAKMIAAHVKLPNVDEASVVSSLNESYSKRLY